MQPHSPCTNIRWDEAPCEKPDTRAFKPRIECRHHLAVVVEIHQNTGVVTIIPGNETAREHLFKDLFYKDTIVRSVNRADLELEAAKKAARAAG